MMIKLLLLALVCALLLGAAASDTATTTTTNISPSEGNDVARKSENLVEAAEVGSDGSVVGKYELLSSENSSVIEGFLPSNTTDTDVLSLVAMGSEGNSSNANSTDSSDLSSKFAAIKTTLKRVATSLSKENIKSFVSYSQEAIKNATFTTEEAVPPVLFFSSLFAYLTFACSPKMVKYGLLLAYLGLIGITAASNFIEIPVYMNLIASSIFIIYIGCHKSLRLLLSEANGGQSAKNKEVLSSDDAMMFPVMASMSLFGLYTAFKFFKPETINLILSAYMAIAAIFALSVTFNPLFSILVGSKEDKYGRDKYLIEYKCEKNKNQLLFGLFQPSAWFGEFEIKLTLADLLSIVSGLLISGFYVRTKHFLLSNVIGISFCIGAISNMSLGSYKTGLYLLVGLFFYDIFWVFGTDVMITVAKSLDAPIKLLFPTSVMDTTTNTLVRKFSLLGLGDIVIPGFFISILLRFDATKAINFQVLSDFILRVKGFQGDGSFSLLGHFKKYKAQETPKTPADCLNSRTFQFALSELKIHLSAEEWKCVDSKFNHMHNDVHYINFVDFVGYVENSDSAAKTSLNQKEIESEKFSRPYFMWTMIGYLTGLTLTVAVMFVFKAGQPALLYLVPACLIFSLLVALLKSELPELMAYNEESVEVKKTQKLEINLNPEPNPNYLLPYYVALLVVWGAPHFIGQNFTFKGVTYFLEIPVPCNLIIVSSLIIYIGCHKSLHLLVSEADGGLKSKNKEVLAFEDAKMFPIIGSATLFGLYCAIKYFGSNFVNILFSVYFALMGTFSLTNMITPLVASFVKSESHFVDKKNYKIPVIGETDILITKATGVSALISCVVGYFYFTTKHYLLSNVYGISFCIQSIESISLGSYKTGVMLLVGLFFYDIFWVFRTDVMVTVAKNIDAPIKLLFPYVVSNATKVDMQLSFQGFKEFSKLLIPRLIPTEIDVIHEKQFSLLGLGDIVIPGFFLAILLRFDAVRSKINSKAVAASMSFDKPYFHSNLLGYMLGLAVTVAVMFFFKAAQPALLYLVPACLLTSLIVAIFRLECTQLILYHEELKDLTEVCNYEPIEFATEPIIAGPEEAALIDFVDGWVDKKDLLPCAAVSITRAGKETFFYSTGFADVEGDMLEKLMGKPELTKKPVLLSKDTIFRIYSMTKPLTSLAIMILVDQKQLSLDDDLDKFIEDFKSMKVIVGGDIDKVNARLEKGAFNFSGSQSVPDLKDAENKIKIRHLLNHTAGFGYGLRPVSICDKLTQIAIEGEKDEESSAGMFYSKLSLEELCKRLARAPLMFEPGTAWYYGLNTDVLARVVEVVSKQTFGEFIKMRILEPLGMVDTDFIVPENKLERLSKCYFKSPTDLSFKPCLSEVQEKNKKDRLESGGGGLLSTVDDYNKFINCLLRDTCYKSSSGNENRLISQELFKEMISNQLKVDGKESDIHTMHFTNPSNSSNPKLIISRGFAESLGPGVGFGFGFSVITDPIATKCRNKGEYGWGGIASTFFTVDPVAKTSCLLMTQLSPSDAYPIRSQLRKHYYKVAHK